MLIPLTTDWRIASWRKSGKAAMEAVLSALVSQGQVPSESFTIMGSAAGITPEPSSLVLFGSGIVGLAGIVRRRLTR